MTNGNYKGRKDIGVSFEEEDEATVKAEPKLEIELETTVKAEPELELDRKLPERSNGIPF